ncbi:MAG: L-histidine N(alpha)-methyltransferase, partial [Rhodothermales bacterium]|nr:L-histidine N(alpha)-methyltransferase [Rhodothermales bacterium]
PVDISAEHLHATADALRRDYPRLRIDPVAADYTADDFQLPDDPDHRRKRVVYFPGSTIGNFSRDEALAFLRHAAEVVGPGGGLLIGVDLKKDPAVLERAYDDEEGVTAAFNLNLLGRINRELGGTFDLDAWHHRAVWNDAAGRVELYLVSARDQTALVCGVPFTFSADEAVHTENSHKYTPDGFARLAAAAGWRLRHRWLDADELFSVQYLGVPA